MLWHGRIRRIGVSTPHRMHTAPEWGELSQRLSALIPKTLIQLESREAAEACAARHGTDPDGHNETYENPQQNC